MGTRQLFFYSSQRHILRGIEASFSKEFFNNLSFDTLQTIFEVFPSAVVITDVQGSFLYVNQRAKDILGFDFGGLTFSEFSKQVKLLKPDGSPLPAQEMPLTDSLVRGKIVRNAEVAVELPTGRRLDLLIGSAPIFGAGVGVAAAVLIFEDMSQQKSAEVALKESEEKYRALVDNLVDAIVVHRNGEFLFANKAALKLYGVKSFDELKLKRIFDYTLSPEQNGVEERVSQLSPEGVRMQSVEEYLVLRSDGTRIPVDAVGVPIHYSGKEAVLVILRDITQRKEMSQKLREYATNLEKLVEARTDEIRRNEKAYHEIYDSFGEALIAIDWELNVIHWNKAAERVTTVKASDAVGKKVYEVLPETLTVDIAPYFESLRESRPARFMMNTVSRETKKPSIFEISTYPSSQGIIIIIEDKTEEEENKRLSAIGATAGMVGHDIRNPLQAMLSDIYLLKEELASTPECRDKEEINESIESLEQNIAYINKIVADLQDYARPINPEYVTVSFSDVLQRIFENIKIPDTIKLSIHVSHLEKIKTDPLLLQRSIANLVNNAIQAMPNGGVLEVTGTREGSKTTITVSDTGVGIPEEVKNHLFKPMMTTKSKGQGFGLAVSKRLIEAMKGSIGFESEEGKGTKFTIKLPEP